MSDQIKIEPLFGPQELFDGVAIMQFTGLKDCNGLNIYEGEYE